MDLGTIRQRLEMGGHYKDPKEVRDRRSERNFCSCTCQGASRVSSMHLV